MAGAIPEVVVKFISGRVAGSRDVNGAISILQPEISGRSGVFFPFPENPPFHKYFLIWNFPGDSLAVGIWGYAAVIWE